MYIFKDIRPPRGGPERYTTRREDLGGEWRKRPSLACVRPLARLPPRGFFPIRVRFSLRQHIDRRTVTMSESDRTEVHLCSKCP